jgi:hypothetical protein
MKASIRFLTFASAALLAVIMISPAAARPFEDVNMNTDISVDGRGNIVVRWMDGQFDEYHVGWSVNGGSRGSRTRPGDKLFTVLMPYSPGSVYQVGVQGCIKHAFGHDQCTSWDTVTCGPAARSPCPGSPEAIRRGGHTY